MGTGFLFQVQDRLPETEINHHCEAASEILRTADEVFSLYKPESEISKLVRNEIPWTAASRVQSSIRELTSLWREKTGGYFDARDQENYDPSGLVKGWAAENAAQYLEANGIVDFTLNAGGDIYLSSELSPTVLSKVGIANLKPISSDEAGVSLVLELSGSGFRAVATSGIAERGEHVWRSATQKRFQQVTVVARSLSVADVWATALLSGGANAWDVFVSNSEDCAGFGVYEDGSLIASAGFSSLLASR